MLKKKKLTFLSGLSLIVIVMITCVILYFKKNPHSCPSSVQDDAAIECYGVIAIDGYGENGFNYYIYDHARRYIIARVKRHRDFRFINDRIYVIDQARDIYINNLTMEYDADYFVEGKMKDYSSKTKEGVPRFFVVDTISGNVSPYVTIDQVPDSEKSIFRELEE